MNAILICFQDAQKWSSVTFLWTFSEKNRGPVYEEGLIDCESSVEFDRRLVSLKGTWDFLVSEFHAWFLQYEAGLFKTHLIKEVTDLAKIEHQYSNNSRESINDNVKDWLG